MNKVQRSFALVLFVSCCVLSVTGKTDAFDHGRKIKQCGDCGGRSGGGKSVSRSVHVSGGSEPVYSHNVVTTPKGQGGSYVEAGAAASVSVESGDVVVVVPEPSKAVPVPAPVKPTPTPTPAPPPAKPTPAPTPAPPPAKPTPAPTPAPPPAKPTPASTPAPPPAKSTPTPTPAPPPVKPTPTPTPAPALPGGKGGFDLAHIAKQVDQALADVDAYLLKASDFSACGHCQGLAKEPVCGSDNKAYENSCLCGCAGYKIACISSFSMDAHNKCHCY